MLRAVQAYCLIFRPGYCDDLVNPYGIVSQEFNGYAQPETAAFPGAAFKGNGAIHVLNDALGNMKAQPRTARPRIKLRVGIEDRRSEEHTSELQSLMRISYAVFCLKKKKKYNQMNTQLIRSTNR